MFLVIRDGEYLETEKLLFGDIQVPQRPHEQSIFMNDEWVFDADTYLSAVEKSEAEEFLKNTDWKILRHQEQQALGMETSLSENEYFDLITERQERRKLLNDIPI